MTRRVAAHVVAGVIAIFAFLVFLLALGLMWPWALLAAAVAYAATVLLIPGERRESIEYPIGLDGEQIEETVSGARATIARIRRTARGLSDATVRRKAADVCRSASKIVDHLERDPDDIRRARQFLAYYLEATERIIQRYAELSVHVSAGGVVEETLGRVAPMLDVIDDAFKRQLAGLLHDDVLDLDSEISLLEKTVRIEGLLGAPSEAPELEPLPPLDGGERGAEPEKVRRREDTGDGDVRKVAQ